jgi:hypothetical protein
MPALTIAPKVHECWIRDTRDGTRQAADCITVLQQDYYAVIHELKASCLALGGTDAACQVEYPPAPGENL